MSFRPIACVVGAGLLGACSTANMAVNKSFDFARVKRVAVVGFKDHPRRAGSGDAVTAAFEQSLLGAGYDVLDRGQVAAALGAKPGALDAKTVKAAGARLGADALVVGQITDFAEPRETTVKVSVMEDYDEPIHQRQVVHTVDANGVPMDVTQDVIVGYRHKRGLRPEPRSSSIPGRLAVSVRMLYAPTGAMVWSGTDATNDVYPDAARGLADEMLKAVKATWPAAKK